jgi:uncharacterized protein
MKESNPFSLTYNPEYFCDREAEVTQLTNNLANGLNTLLHSPRRLGKTALILHSFNRIEQSKMSDTFYIDLFATGQMTDLIRILAEKVLKKYHSQNLLQGIKSLFKGINASLTFSPDGTPALGLNINEKQFDTTLAQLFEFLEDRKKPVVIALDEFQEVANYPEKAEAILRTHIQHLSNVKFIFSGSTSHLLQEMFLGAKRPFYQSAEVMVLDKIERTVYSEFITDTFGKNRKKINQDAVDYILDFTDNYTYYTQLTCNQCFFNSDIILDIDQTRQIIQEYLESRKVDYLNILNMLSENQKKMVIAIAKDGLVEKPSAMEFLQRNKLPSASSSLQALKTLNDKEIIYKTLTGYKVYDVFFERFLEKYF